MPKISIIIPIYNVDKYLCKTLDSVINQTFEDIEIICINDGSTDNSLQILKDYALKDHRIVVIDQENKGVATSRNIGLENAKSDFIIFLDGDDWLDESTCEEAYNKIMETNADIVCYGRYDVFEDKFKIHSNYKYLELYENETNIDIDIISKFINNCWQKIFNLNFLKKNQIYFPDGINVFEDGIFNLCCLYKKPKYRFLNKNLHYYRLNRPASLTSGNKNAIKNVINADKYFLKSSNFVNCQNEKYKLLTLEKIIMDLNYFYKRKDNFWYRLKFIKEIKDFKSWLYENIDNELLNKTNNIKFIDSLINPVFFIQNINNRITINFLGLKMKIKNRG